MRQAFNIRIGLGDDANKEKICRKAVRAVIVKDEKILLLKSNLGDYKLPGGGVEESESHEMALMREIEEETGFTCQEIQCQLGQVIERKNDEFDSQKIFEMTSSYYACSVSGDHGKQSLTLSEKKLELEPVWVSIADALKENIEVLETGNYLTWTHRETVILQILMMSTFEQSLISRSK